MKNFFLKILILNLIILINIIILIVLPVPYFKESKAIGFYLAIMANKNDLLKKIKKNKIIIVGGSGVLYNINCKRIQDEINIPVINKGSYGGFGLKFILEELSYNINNGDIIIVIPEYALLTLDDYINKCEENSLKWILIRNPIGSIKYFYYSNKLNLIMPKFIEYIQEKNLNIYIFINKIFLSNFKEKIYIGYGIYNYNFHINENGDRKKKRDHLMVDKITESLGAFPEMPKKDAIEVLNNFYILADKKGAKVYLYFSCYPESEIINKNEKQLKNYYEILNKELKFKVICKPERTLFDDEYFLNTVNHLNSKGAEIMTERLIEDLKKYVL